MLPGEAIGGFGGGNAQLEESVFPALQTMADTNVAVIGEVVR
jgi:hypothetical protein